MAPPLLDDTWTRRGISVLWDADQLDQLCKPGEVVSVRQFLQLHDAGWPDDGLPLVNDRTLVVAGIESCIDALNPDEAVEWLVTTFYEALLGFQREVAAGGTEAALVLWLAEKRRLVYQTSDEIWHWHCGTEYKDQTIPLSKCLFNGGYRDQRPVHVKEGKKEICVGIYHPRIAS